jgi:hypothetical protein
VLPARGREENGLLFAGCDLAWQRDRDAGDDRACFARSEVREREKRDVRALEPAAVWRVTREDGRRGVVGMAE